ncbi:hypothetical protein [Bradyrhizobium sp. 2S1]|uniref:hypothetical protein n=1 Tax=Bradyrhizobium sp. 2S1 TaxID=1404429 RepID=UPI00140853B5|nr:hypothetical protein [Bradyrhizobium sp. 2S1]MCK7674091.1 hypothetical protein [Bradyrhizobium sp. 2S1]
MRRSLNFFTVVAASFVVILQAAWFVLDPHLPFEQANATTSTGVPSGVLAPEPFKKGYAANQTTTRILAQDQAGQLAFWTSVLKKKKQACGVVVRNVYQGGTESGIDSWSIRCRDGNQYSISLSPDWQGSEAEVPASGCNGNAFIRSAD